MMVVVVWLIAGGVSSCRGTVRWSGELCTMDIV